MKPIFRLTGKAFPAFHLPIPVDSCIYHGGTFGYMRIGNWLYEYRRFFPYQFKDVGL